MRRYAPGALLVVLIGCGGGNSPTGPSPQPSPTPTPQPAPSFTGSVTDTVSGAPVLGFSATLSGSRVTISAPGYLTRETRNGASVDLIPEAGFDLEFYRQFARGTLEDPIQPLTTLTAAPSIYIQTAGLSASTVALMVARTRDVLPAMTGGRFTVGVIETGDTARAPVSGWIMVELATSPDNAWCGLSFIGASAGHIQLNVSPESQRRDRPTGCFRPLYDVLGHELGHALGFYHVPETTALMSPTRPLSHSGIVSARERSHASIAYKRSRGNRDIDIDPVTLTTQAFTDHQRLVID